MIQRIQSFFLLLAVLGTVCTFVFPMTVYKIGNESAYFNNYGLFILKNGKYSKEESSYLYLVATFVILSLLVTLFLYKKRNLQMKICRLTYLLILVQFTMYYLLPTKLDVSLESGNNIIHNYGIAYYIQLISLVSVFVAELFIKKDERLVRSADRLR